MTEKIQPEHTIRLGNIKATIWPNEGKTGTYYNVAIRRLYKDANGNPTDTTSFYLKDLPLVASVAQLAVDYLVKKPN